MYFPNELYNRRAKSMLQEELKDDLALHDLDLQLGEYRPKRRGLVAQRARRWAVVGMTLAVMLTSAVASGETRTPCEQAYQVSGLSGQQQMSFAEFREVYGAGICAPGSGT